MAGDLHLNGQSLFVSCGSVAHWPILFIFSLTLHPADSSAADAARPVSGPTPSNKPSSHAPGIAAPLISTSAVLFALLLVMGVINLLRRRLRQRRSNRIVEDEEESVGGTAGANTKAVEAEGSVPVVVAEYNWEDVKRMTGNFSEMIGAGGFSTVYLGRLSGEQPGLGAVKVHSGSERLNMAFRQELDILLRVRHEHIVRLIGFCDDEGEGALVSEYIPNGNLQERLHSRGAIKTDLVLSWRNRMAIAYQVAQAIEYLHEKCAQQIVHGDIKASNILLDGLLNCKLCDFGSAKMGFSSLVSPSSSSSNSPRLKQIIMGSPGYTDPHYLRSGVASKKNDIYSYGVLLLELITGMEAFCSSRGHLVTSLAVPLLREGCSEVPREMIDPVLNGDFNLDEAKAMVSLARSCLQQSPTYRPSATQIVDVIQEMVPSALFSSISSAEKGTSGAN